MKTFNGHLMSKLEDKEFEELYEEEQLLLAKRALNRMIQTAGRFCKTTARKGN